jgi:S-adenosylhomocysteine hydrolase
MKENERKHVEEAYREFKSMPGHEVRVIRDFYDDIIARLKSNTKASADAEECCFIVVAHLVPTLPFYLEALAKVGQRIILIPKGSSDDEDTVNWIYNSQVVSKFLYEEDKDEFYSQCGLNHGQCSLGEVFKEAKHLKVFYEKYIKQQEIQSPKFIVVDIGGYFAPSVRHVYCQDPEKEGNQWISEWRKWLLGYVEDTENGYQKYNKEIEKMASNKDLPKIISVARSEIKNAEDYNVGKAVTEAVDHILRISSYTHLAENKTILVIGYGKVGAAAAKVAAEKTRGPVLVCEKNMVRKLVASGHSFKVVELSDGLKVADIIISCTGSKALKASHIEVMKKNVWIASCTSRDDEFDKTFLDKLVARDENAKDGDLWRYQIGSRTIDMLNNGNSVNFVQKAVHGYFIHGVLASLLISAFKLLDGTKLENERINDFNHLKLPNDKDISASDMVARLLMKHKLRTESMVNNYSATKRRYIPRVDELRGLYATLLEKHRVVISGGPKSGKSQMIDQFIEAYQFQYDIIWHFNAELDLEGQYEKLHQELMKLQELQKIDYTQEKSDQTRAGKEREETPASQGSPKKRKSAVTPSKTPPAFVKRVHDFLENSSYSYLLVFDGVQIKDTVDKYVPNIGGSMLFNKADIVITTSNKELQNLAEYGTINLKAYEHSELLKFVINNPKLTEVENAVENLLERIQDVTNEDDEAQIVGIINVCAHYAQWRYRHDSKFTLSILEYELRGLDLEKALDFFTDDLQEGHKFVLKIFYSLQLEKCEYVILDKALIKIMQTLLDADEQKCKEYVSDLENRGLIEKQRGMYCAVYRGVWNIVEGETENSPELAHHAIKAVVKLLCNGNPEQETYVKALKIIEELEEKQHEFYKTWLRDNQFYARKMYKKMALAFNDGLTPFPDTGSSSPPAPETESKKESYLKKALEKAVPNTSQYAKILEKLEQLGSSSLQNSAESSGKIYGEIGWQQSKKRVERLPSSPGQNDGAKRARHEGDNTTSPGRS